MIGAGFAGLAAAHALHSAGQSVVVIEARPRIGGRIHTSRTWPDLPMDLGASWIHGTRRNPLTDLARAANAQTVATDYDAALILGADGRPSTADFAAADRILQRALRQAERLEQDVSVAHALAASPDYQNASADLQRAVAALVNSSLEHEYSGSASELSAWHGQDAKAYGGPDLLFPQGFDQLTQYLARELIVRLSERVTRIAPGAVTLASGEVLAARAVICTLPLGVLQSGEVIFAEPLSSERQAAIERLKMGVLNKCWLQFEKVTWPDDVDWIGWLGPQPGYWAEWVSLAHRLHQPILVGFNAAEAAIALEQYSDADTAAAAHDALRAMFGSRFPAPKQAQITRWAQDPLAGGSYSFNAVGTKAQTRQSLAGSDWGGALWFAGEATSAYHFGTAHGAFESGQAAAAAVLARL